MLLEIYISLPSARESVYYVVRARLLMLSLFQMSEKHNCPRFLFSPLCAQPCLFQSWFYLWQFQSMFPWARKMQNSCEFRLCSLVGQRAQFSLARARWARSCLDMVADNARERHATRCSKPLLRQAWMGCVWLDCLVPQVLDAQSSFKTAMITSIRKPLFCSI